MWAHRLRRPIMQWQRRYGRVAPARLTPTEPGYGPGRRSWSTTLVKIGAGQLIQADWRSSRSGRGGRPPGGYDGLLEGRQLG
jgi:hypothetical protein